MTSYRPSAKTLPFVLLGLFGILYIYDAGLEQEKILPEIVSETISVPTKNTPGLQTRKIHIVQEGENLSVIFEKHNVSLNNTYKILQWNFDFKNPSRAPSTNSRLYKPRTPSNTRAHGTLPTTHQYSPFRTLSISAGALQGARRPLRRPSYR